MNNDQLFPAVHPTETNETIHAPNSSARAKDSGALSFLWLELTYQCNLQCVHCYSESSPTSVEKDILRKAEYARVLQEARELGCAQMQFIGGEPTLNRDLPSLIETARELGYSLVEVFTNLKSLSDPLLDVFKAHRVSVATSYYSNNPAVHDSITQSSGSFAQTTRNITRVLDAGLDLRVGVIRMDDNADTVEATFDHLRGLGVKRIGMDHIRDFGRAKPKPKCDMKSLCGNCAGNVLAVGPDGVVAPCIMSRQWPVGSVLKTPLRKIACSDKLSEVRRRIADATVTRGEDPCYPQCAPVNTGCYPNCGPMAQCQPCGPNGGQKCQPSGWCNPGN